MRQEPYKLAQIKYEKEARQLLGFLVSLQLIGP